MADAIPIVADHIRKLGVNTGLFRVHTDEAKHAITAYWKRGPVPESVRAYAASKPLGVTVAILARTRYSEAELDAARRKLLNSPLVARLTVQGAGFQPDGSGLHIAFRRTKPLTPEEFSELRRVTGINDIEAQMGVPARLY